MRHEPRRSAFSQDLLRRFAESECFRLGKNIGHEQVVVAAKRVQGIRENDKVARDEFRSLMNELVERMLAVSLPGSPQ